ncbi:hypothetical protein ACWKWU_11575 [Chitinophaga lutea]
MPTLNSQPLSFEDRGIIENALEHKYGQLKTMAGWLAVGMIIAAGYMAIRRGEVPFLILFCVGVVIYAIGFCALWFGSIAKLKKDQEEGQKVTFEAKIKDKVKSDELGVEEYYLVVSDNPYNIKKVDVTEYVFDEVRLFAEAEITVTAHAHLFLQCRFA